MSLTRRTSIKLLVASQEVVISLPALRLCTRLKESNVVDGRLDVSGVPASILASVVIFCEHVLNEANKSAEEKDAWEREFLSVPRDTLFQYLQAGQTLGLEPLMRVVAEHIASMLKGKTHLEMRAILGIRNDLSPDEEERIVMENSEIAYNTRRLFYHVQFL